MNHQQINLVEEYIKNNVPEGIKILNIKTIENKKRQTKDPAFVTHVQIEQEKTGLQGNQSFNSLKIYRELKKKEKYNE
jgi:hypothetical protein